jgi:siroheme decarboxylase
MNDLDGRDRDLLVAMQGEIPLISTPFAGVGQNIDMSEKEVLKRCARLRKLGVLGSISCQFDSRQLGYRTALVAISLPDDQMERAASLINLHPGVTQNYQRNHELNLWFTLAVAPDSRLGLDRTIDTLAAETLTERVRRFPALRQFRSDSADGVESFDEESGPSGDPLTEEEIVLVRLLQGDLPMQPRPFEVLARMHSIEPDIVMEALQRFVASRRLRRLTATVQLRRPGFGASALGVWKVPEERIDEVGPWLVLQKGISQCFVRPTYEDWPFNLFTPIHGRSVDECEGFLNDLAAEASIDEVRALFPVREFKRGRLQLFSPELKSWEDSRQQVDASAVG